MTNTVTNVEENYQENKTNIVEKDSNNKTRDNLFYSSSENKPNLKDLKVIKITNLEGLVNVAEQTKNNIIYYELIKNQVSNLYVIVNEYVYIYTVTDKKI